MRLQAIFIRDFVMSDVEELIQASSMDLLADDAFCRRILRFEQRTGEKRHEDPLTREGKIAEEPDALLDLAVIGLWTFVDCYYLDQRRVGSDAILRCCWTIRLQVIRESHQWGYFFLKMV
jgi:hypothetical protein